MAEVEDQIIAAGAQIIWVLEQSGSFDPGTAALCRDFVNSRGSSAGWCVGDSQMMGQTNGSTSVFDDAPFSIGRGFDLIVSRRDMVIRDAFTHGTPSGNDNPSGQEVLDRVQAVIDSL